MADDSGRKAALREQLARDRDEFVATVSALGEGDLERSAGHAGDWTVKDLIGHIAYAEGGMLPLVQRGASGAGRQVPADFDLDRWNESRVRRAREQDVAQLLARLAASREQTFALLDSLGDADLDRPVHHPSIGETTVAGVFAVIGQHERQHGEEIRAACGG